MKKTLIFFLLILLLGCKEDGKETPKNYPQPIEVGTNLLVNGSVTNDKIESVHVSKIIGLADSATKNFSSSNSPENLVMRDSNGDFEAGTITANLNGNANSSINFSGNIRGDVSGTQNSTVVEKIRGRNISASTPSLNQVLTWDGSVWTPQSISIPVTSVSGKTGNILLVAEDISPGTNNTTLMTNNSGNTTWVAVPTGRQIFISSSGNFTVPQTINSISVECWGAGGGGGPGNTSQGGGGGGQGGYFRAFSSVQPNQVISVTIGLGGGSGVAGSDTIFGTMTAGGGTAGRTGASGGAASAQSTVTASGAQFFVRGLGGSARSGAAGGRGGGFQNNGGAGGASGVAGSAGLSVGVGGGGGGANQNGGNGANGACIVSY